MTNIVRLSGIPKGRIFCFGIGLSICTGGALSFRIPLGSTRRSHSTPGRPRRRVADRDPAISYDSV